MSNEMDTPTGFPIVLLESHFVDMSQYNATTRAFLLSKWQSVFGEHAPFAPVRGGLTMTDEEVNAWGTRFEETKRLNINDAVDPYVAFKAKSTVRNETIRRVFDENPFKRFGATVTNEEIE